MIFSIRNQVGLVFGWIGLFLPYSTNAQQGPYSPSAGQMGSDAIHRDSSLIVSWAVTASLNRGWQNLMDTTLGVATSGNATDATDKSGTHGVVSLGDGGSATLTFGGEIFDGPGVDFAVFENSFDGLFLELAFVEVSSDGINFFRFESSSLTDTSQQIGSFDHLDASNINNLAGKYISQYGTPFDLNELSGINGLDINKITHVRVIDVVGSTDPLKANVDSDGRAINDPFPTPFPTGGFDLDAIGVIHLTPTSISESEPSLKLYTYPNPVTNELHINIEDGGQYSFKVLNLSGKALMLGQLENRFGYINVSSLPGGTYLLHVENSEGVWIEKFIKNNL